MGQMIDRRAAALVVEDDISQRELLGTIIEETDMRVLECSTAEEAITLMEAWGDCIVLLLTDVRLAGVRNGVDLAREVRERWPHVRVITTSGVYDSLKLPPEVAFLPKPWRSLDLLIAAEKALAGA